MQQLNLMVDISLKQMFGKKSNLGFNYTGVRTIEYTRLPKDK